MYDFNKSIACSDRIIIAQKTKLINKPTDYKLQHIKSPGIPNKALALSICYSGSPVSTQQIQEDVKQYNDYVGFLNEVPGFITAFTENDLTISKTQALAIWPEEVVKKIFSLNRYYFETPLHIEQDILYESVARSKYKQVEDDPSSIKIQQQTVASPIFFWTDFDVWLYILSENIDFNEAYRLGYDRVGCWCCPNNNARSQFLSQIYMPEQSKKWHEFLIDFAKKIGKPDPENYVDSGKWKARQGGNGLVAANDVKIKFTNCTTEEHAKIYKLVKPFSDDLVGMFVPFGKIAPELGQKLLNEVIILDVRSNVPILSIQPFRQDGYEYAVKVRTMNVADHDSLQRMVSYQIRKFNACRKCLKCESLCKAGAITINSLGYFIDPKKCVHCKMCVTAKYLHGGCLMDKFLRTK